MFLFNMCIICALPVNEGRQLTIKYLIGQMCAICHVLLYSTLFYETYLLVSKDFVLLPTLYWLPKLHIRPYNARFIANSSSCTTTVLSKLLIPCLSAVENIGLDTMILFTKGTELAIFCQLKIPMKFSINLYLNTFWLLNCHMIFLHCIQRYLVIL